jgi:predicted MFS family arabinose efflux permease
MHMDTAPAVPVAEADKRYWFQLLSGYHWFVLAVAALGWLFDCMDQRIFIASRQAALTELLREPGGAAASAADVTWYSGLATTIFMLGWATGGLIFGVLGDRWGRARTMLLTILAYSLFTGLTALSQHWWDYMTYRFLTGMGVGGEFAAGVALLAEAMPARARTWALGLLQALSAIGNITGSLLSGIVQDWRDLFLVGIVPALWVILVMRRLKEPETWKQTVKKLEATEGPAERSLGSLGDLLHERRWRYHTIIGVLLAVAGVIGLWGVGFWTFELVDKALTERGYEKADINSIKAAGTALQDVGAALGILVFSWIAVRMGRRAAFACGFTAALGATVLVFGTLSRESDVYWMLPLLGFCNLSIFGGYAIYFPELFPTRLRSTGTGFCYNVARYLAAVGPITLGYLVIGYRQLLTVSGDNPLPFRYATITVASVYVLGLLVLPFAPETRGKPLPE